MTTNSKLSWWRRGLKFLLFALVVVATLLVLVGSVISFQGRREWDVTKRELLAKGEKLSLVELAPPAIPDEMNFFADPMWEEIVTKVVPPAMEGSVHSAQPAVPPDKQRLGVFKRPLSKEEIAALKKRYPLFADKITDGATPIGVASPLWATAKEHNEEWRTELAKFTLAALEPAQPMMGRAVELLERPAARFPVSYELGFYSTLPHIGSLMAMGQAFRQRTCAELQLGQGTLALRDVLAIVGLSRTLQAEPLLISYLVRCSLLSIATKLVETGLISHAWNDADLAALEQALGQEELLPGLVQSLRGERGGFNATMETMRSGDKEPYTVIIGMQDKAEQPPGWLMNVPARIYLAVLGTSDQAYENRYTQQRIEAATGWPSVTGQQDDFAKLMANQTFRYTHLMSTLSMPAWLGVFNRAALTQTNIVQARIACALERYYLAHREYPKTLGELVPEYLSAVPTDILIGQPMHYERTAPGAFRLWSVGVDGKDDGGLPAKKSRVHEGDWVWGKMP